MVENNKKEWKFALCQNIKNYISCKGASRFVPNAYPNKWVGWFKETNATDITVTNRQIRLKCFTWPVVFDCWELIYVIFLNLRNKELLAKLSKFTKRQPFLLQKTPRTFLSENPCKQFFLSQIEKNHVTRLATAKN